MPLQKKITALLLSAGTLTLISCAVPDRQGSAEAPTPSPREILEKSAAAQAAGVSKVEVGLDGDWKIAATATQKALTDPQFRRSSVEEYRPNQGSVRQVHTGPGGTKTVIHRIGGQPGVSYNGSPASDPEQLDAAALVAEAYPLFLLGAAHALKYGSEFRYAGSEKVDGHACYRLDGRVADGFGNSPNGDLLRLYIDKESFVCRRVYFSINGLESTRGAEVDVTMSEFVSGPGGTLWPTRFYEWVRKPFIAPAHEWRVTSLAVDGRKVR